MSRGKAIAPAASSEWILTQRRGGAEKKTFRRKKEPLRLSPRLCASASSLVLVSLVAMLLAGCGGGGQDGAGTAALKQTTTKTGAPMLLVPAGQFVMGSDAGEADERPARTVKLAAFWMDRHEVTQADYQALMGRNPAKFQQAERPVERVSWYWAIKYCNMRSLRDGLMPCYNAETLACDFAADGYRLPTEAEWEYACRAGTSTAYSFGDAPAALGVHGWYKDNADGQTQPVEKKKPNPWGFFDMHGNVAEWCNDFYGEGYAAGAAENPTGPAAGEERVLRGGSWRNGAEACRSGARFSEPPGLADVCFGYEAYGFRCVRRAKPGE